MLKIKRPVGVVVGVAVQVKRDTLLHRPSGAQIKTPIQFFLNPFKYNNTFTFSYGDLFFHIIYLHYLNIYLFIYVSVYVWATPMCTSFLFGLKKVCKKQSYKSRCTQLPRLTKNRFANQQSAKLMASMTLFLYAFLITLDFWIPLSIMESLPSFLKEIFAIQSE